MVLKLHVTTYAVFKKVSRQFRFDWICNFQAHVGVIPNHIFSVDRLVPLGKIFDEIERNVFILNFCKVLNLYPLMLLLEKGYVLNLII